MAPDMSPDGYKIISFMHLLFLFVLIPFRNADCGSIVRTLPGFPGILPFNLETGYISVGRSELFYLFVESQRNPQEDPLLIYLIGGPGCSALNGFLFQTGPLHFNETDYTGGLPSLHLYPYAWTKTASIIFVDAPIGTGYSYSTSWEDYYVSDTQYANQTHMFIRKWFSDHPEFIKNRFFVATDSYSGIIAPVLAQAILNDNKAGVEPQISLVGIISGSPHTDLDLEQNSKIPFAYQMALLSQDLYLSAQTNCKGDYIDEASASAECLEDLKEIDQCLDQINDQMVLAPKCATLSPRSNDEYIIGYLKKSTGHLLLPSSGARDFWCKNFAYLLLDMWANDKSVQRALHVREGTIKEWYRCNLSLSENTYDVDIGSSIDYHQNLTSTGIQLLIYSGDHDMVITHTSTENWISNLSLTVDDSWRPWFVDGQIAGYTVKYTNYGYGLTYATVKGSGHSPTEWKGKQSFEMFLRWIRFFPL